MMHIHFLLHAPFEKPGAIESWIARKGYSASSTSPYKGELFPSPDHFDFLIIMGGPQSPKNLIQFPYLKDEIQFTQRAIESNKNILGICLGAQIIGEALGAKTECSPHKEVGVFPVSLTPAGLNDRIFKHLPHQFDAMHWHNDMPGVPDNAAILAESLGCPRQIVRFADKIYGLQCHLEMTEPLIRGMLDHCKEDLQPSLFTQKVDKMLTMNFSDINEKLYFILDKISESK